jgi:3-phenylpropionate/cinnamic acid dioxygenase small subunit
VSDLEEEVTRFLYREARYQDTHDYDAWEALWTDDGVYWIPANGADIDPETKMSILYDNRSRIALRVKQLHTGRRHSQSPPSSLARVVSNIEVGETDAKGQIKVLSNALVYEHNARGETVWGCRNEFLLRRVEGQLKMARKKVVLANNQAPLYTLSFLI